MAYIGKQPGTGVRNRFLYTATAGQTTFTTSDSNLALSYSDALYMDVYLNGVLLDPANDYTATSGTSVVLGSGATAGDVLEIVVYDVFSVFNNTIDGNFDVGGDLTISDKIIHSGDTNTAIRFPAADTVTVETGGAERMRMTSDGILGINTSSPSNANLDVAGRGRFLQDAAATTGAVIIRESSGGVGGHLQFVTNDNTGQRGFIAVDSASTMNLGGVAVKATSTPAFLARPTSTQANIANDNSVVTVAMGTEIFDQGGNFASNTFTAPVTGRYQFNVIVYLTQVDSTASYYQVRLDTSNRTYFGLLDFASTDLGLGFQTIAISVLADMDANDTATVNIQQNAGSQQTDISTGSAFSGFLAC